MEKEQIKNSFLNANSIFEEVEDEHGKTLNLAEEQSKNLVGNCFFLSFINLPTIFYTFDYL